MSEDDWVAKMLAEALLGPSQPAEEPGAAEQPAESDAEQPHAEPPADPAGQPAADVTSAPEASVPPVESAVEPEPPVVPDPSPAAAEVAPASVTIEPEPVPVDPIPVAADPEPPPAISADPLPEPAEFVAAPIVDPALPPTEPTPTELTPTEPTPPRVVARDLSAEVAAALGPISRAGEPMPRRDALSVRAEGSGRSVPTQPITISTPGTEAEAPTSPPRVAPLPDPAPARTADIAAALDQVPVAESDPEPAAAVDDTPAEHPPADEPTSGGGPIRWSAAENPAEPDPTTEAIADAREAERRQRELLEAAARRENSVGTVDPSTAPAFGATVGSVALDLERSPADEVDAAGDEGRSRGFLRRRRKDQDEAPRAAVVEDEPDQEDSAIRGILEWIGVLAGAVIVALVLRAFLFQAFYIPSESMEATLRENDRVLVNKVTYRFRDVERGEVVVFRRPDEEQADIRDLIKRVIALPGETVEARDNTIFIDGQVLIEPYLAPGEVIGDFGPIEVPEGEYFVMGDNRDESYDSRFFGTVAEERIIGRAFVLFWPFDRVGSL